MEPRSRFAPPEWRAAWDAARQGRTGYMGRLSGRFASTRCGTGSAAGLGRWIVLASACLLSAAIVTDHDMHAASEMVAISLASLISSIAGFAFSAICGAVLFHLSDDTVRVVQIMITCSIANQAAMTWAGRHHINWRELRVYLSGGTLGLGIGVWVLLYTNRSLYIHILGGFLLAYGAFQLIRPPLVVRRQHVLFDFGAGFLSGITGGAAGFPGVFVTIWCSMKGWDKIRQRAVFQPFILIMQIAALLAISLCRPVAGHSFDMTDLLFIPGSLLGTSLGLALYRRMSDRQFARAVNILLIVSGAGYVV